jgi:hypothetical protein
MTALKDSWKQHKGSQRSAELLRDLMAAGEAAGVNAKLSELCVLLEGEFTEEESPGGLYEELGARCPNRVPKINALVEEHAALLGRAGALKGKFEEALVELSELHDAIHAHHTSEHRLLLDSYLVDHGGS